MNNTLSIRQVSRIPVQPPIKAILRRLRYHALTTVVPKPQMREMETVIHTAAGLCRPRGRFAVTAVTVENDVVSCRGCAPMQSTSLAALLTRSFHAAILGVTVGPVVVERIGSLMKGSRFVEAVIYDAVASEMTEAAMEFLHRNVRQERSRFGQGVTRRYSPGYGDLPLTCQQTLHEALHMYEIGVSLSPRWMLIPEKSTLAIAGIEEKE